LMITESLLIREGLSARASETRPDARKLPGNRGLDRLHGAPP
jgi:hypothetical protein